MRDRLKAMSEAWASTGWRCFKGHLNSPFTDRCVCGFRRLSQHQVDHLRVALHTTAPIVEMLLKFGSDEAPEVAVSFAQQGLRAARLLGLYFDDVEQGA